MLIGELPCSPQVPLGALSYLVLFGALVVVGGQDSFWGRLHLKVYYILRDLTYEFSLILLDF